jgi:Kef-type K+ transport system membrane component KefB
MSSLVLCAARCVSAYKSLIAHKRLATLLCALVCMQVIGGIILGPSFLGQIKGFSETLFPQKSTEALKLTATLGLIL